MKKQFSIIIPAFEEETRLGETLRRVFAFIATEKLSAEVIIVDDGSRDKTVAVAETACAEFPANWWKIIRYERNRGKGFAVKTGLLAANGDIAVFSDADLSTPIEEFYKLVKPIESGACDVAFGSRALDRSLIGAHQPWRREQGGRVFNLIVKALTGLPFMDTQCGFKAFNMKKFRPLLERMTIDRFGFDVEFLFVANLYGMKLEEVPVRWNNVEGSKVNVFRDSRRMLGEVRRIRRNAKRGIYGQTGEANAFEFADSPAQV
jgi:dolichyl-phosphate beta-glucosyltransferase